MFVSWSQIDSLSTQKRQPNNPLDVTKRFGIRQLYTIWCTLLLSWQLLAPNTPTFLFRGLLTTGILVFSGTCYIVAYLEDRKIRSHSSVWWFCFYWCLGKPAFLTPRYWFFGEFTCNCLLYMMPITVKDLELNHHFLIYLLCIWFSCLVFVICTCFEDGIKIVKIFPLSSSSDVVIYRGVK